MERFHAQIRQLGPNAYVDVPKRVTARYAVQSGSRRITVKGTLRGTGFRATLVPTQTGRHRLYLDPSVRASAKVDVGDAVIIALEALTQAEVAPSKDVAAALRRTRGARAAFAKLSPSHRRELLRYIAEAPSATARQARLDKALRHLLGRAPRKRKWAPKRRLRRK
ncbi:MAG: DUF1905 domain-containing protein [Myxococcota bacterium]